MRWSSSLIVVSFSAFFRWSMPSRRTWRAATRACSAYWCAILTSSLRRCSLSSGSGMRSVVPSMIGLKPRLDSRIARSTAPTIDLSQTETEIMRGSGTDDGRHLVERHRRAVGRNLDRIEQIARGAPGAQRSEIVLEGGDRAVHAPMQVIEIHAVRHFSSPSPTCSRLAVSLRSASRHHRAAAVAPQNSAEAALLVNRIDDYRNVVFARKRNRGRVHDRPGRAPAPRHG